MTGKGKAALSGSKVDQTKSSLDGMLKWTTQKTKKITVDLEKVNKRNNNEPKTVEHSDSSNRGFNSLLKKN